MDKRKKSAAAAYGHRAPRRNILPLLVVLTAAVGISLAVAFAWQALDPGGYTPDPFAGQSSSKHDPVTSGSSASGTGESSGSGSVPGDFVALVPRGDWLPTSYFDDALFIGDSITDGIKIYDVMSNATVLSDTGINLSTIFTKEVISSGGSNITIIEAAEKENPGKIYLLMGVNSIQANEESFIAAYGKLVDTLKAQHPKAIFYVQSILPVTAAYEQKTSAVTDNAKIDRYNAAILEMCRQKGVYYLDVAEDFKDEAGALPAEASPKDGIHFGRTWYMTWFDYLKTHGAAVAE